MYTKNTIDLYNGRVVEHRMTKPGRGHSRSFYTGSRRPEVLSLPFYMPFLL